MSTLPPNDDQWSPCPRGAIQAVVQAERDDLTRRQILKVAGTVAGAGIMGVVGWNLVSPPQSASNLLVCDDVRRLLPQYIKHSLSPEVTLQVDTHLAACKHCSEILAQLQTANA